MSILSKIIEEKKREVSNLPSEALHSKPQREPVPFRQTLQRHAFPAIIAEVKKGSPSKGTIRADLDPVACAKHYVQNGCAALSVLTDSKFFMGSISYLKEIREACPNTPILRKDFIIDEKQIAESVAAGADAILLIVKALEPDRLNSLFETAVANNLECLVEVHNTTELSVVINTLGTDHPSLVVGVNNRDLDTFKTSTSTTKQIADNFPSTNTPLISESGINSGGDIVELASMGANGFLVGEALVREGDPGENLAKIIADARRANL